MTKVDHITTNFLIKIHDKIIQKMNLMRNSMRFKKIEFLFYYYMETVENTNSEDSENSEDIANRHVNSNYDDLDIYLYIKDKRVKMDPMIRAALEKTTFNDLDYIELAKIFGFNDNEIKMLIVFWDPFYNKSWIYVSTEIIHDTFGYTKNTSSSTTIYKKLTNQFEEGLEYKEVTKDHKLVVEYEKAKKNKETRGGALKKYFIITGETLKSMCMMANTTKGKETRLYFIKVESLCAFVTKYTIAKLKEECLIAEHAHDKQLYKLLCLLTK
jgi:phage anti-repressor protein